SSSPPAGDAPRDEPLESYLEYVVDVLIPAAGVEPTRLGFLGYSFGGHLATYVAASDERTRALAVFGGVGVLDAARAAGQIVGGGLTTRLFRNAGDPVPDPVRYVGALPKALAASVAATRPG